MDKPNEPISIRNVLQDAEDAGHELAVALINWNTGEVVWTQINPYQIEDLITTGYISHRGLTSVEKDKPDTPFGGMHGFLDPTIT